MQILRSAKNGAAEILDRARAQIRSILRADQDDLFDLIAASGMDLDEMVPVYMALVAGQEVVDGTETDRTTVEQAKERILDDCAEAIANTIATKVPMLCDRKMDKLVRAQAYILAQYPQTTPQTESECYEDASRYVCFLIMDSILHNCSKHDGCLLLSLPNGCFDMMRDVTVEDYVRYKAYLRSLSRRDESHDQSKQNLDYFDALANLDRDFVCMCPSIVGRPGQVSGLLRREVEGYRNSPDAIVSTKQAMAARLGGGPVAADLIREFVSTYGESLSCVLSGDRPSSNVCQKVRRCMREQRQIVNLLEYSTRTLLLAEAA